MDWELKKELKDQLAREEGYYRYAAGTRERFALVYPNSYFVGMSNLGLHAGKKEDCALRKHEDAAHEP